MLTIQDRVVQIEFMNAYELMAGGGLALRLANPWLACFATLLRPGTGALRRVVGLSFVIPPCLCRLVCNSLRFKPQWKTGNGNMDLDAQKEAAETADDLLGKRLWVLVGK